MIDYQLLPPIKYPLANKFYRSHQARGKASGGDIVSVARDNSKIVAVARLSPIAEQYWLLTGVYVAPVFRSQGIALQLINQLTNVEPSVYTFALSPLRDFYLSLGFIELATSELPCELAQRFKAYQQQGRDIIAMIKSP